MKKRFSLSRILHSDRLMMLFSVVLAIVVWAVVISGPSNIEERSISLTANVDLANSYAYQSGLRVIGESEFPVTVNVSGAWSVISKLTENDLRVRADISEVTAPGELELPLTVSRNSLVTDYEILSVSPSSVAVVFDNWENGLTFPLQVDISALSVSDPEQMHIGDPVIDKTDFPSGELTVEGPQSTVSRIAQLMLKVTQQDVLSDVAQYDVPITALDENGEEVDLSFCSIREIPSNTVHITVPVWLQRHVDVGYTLINAPQGLSADALLSTSPQGLDLLGTATDLDAVTEQLQNLGTLDFEMFTLTNRSQSFQLNIPDTVQVIDPVEQITVTLDTSGMSTRSIDLPVSEKQMRTEGDRSGYSLTIPPQTLTGVTLVGPKAAVDAITPEDLTLVLNFGDSITAGTRQYPVRVEAKNGVWVYPGPADNHLSVYATLS